MSTTRRNGHESFERLQALLHYVCDKAKDPSELGRVKLNKVPWYADTISFLLRGESITGERYIKRQFGPVPARFVPAQKQLEADNKIVKGKTTVFNLTKHEFISIKEPDISMFSSEDMEIINSAFEHVCLNHTAKSISEETHDHIWELAEIGEEMPLQTVFASQFAEITEDDVAWAKQELQLAAAA
jgi:predicted small metal-binding protein